MALFSPHSHGLTLAASLIPSSLAKLHSTHNPDRFYAVSFLRGGYRLPSISFRNDCEGGDHALFDQNVKIVFVILHVPSPIMHIFGSISISSVEEMGIPCIYAVYGFFAIWNGMGAHYRNIMRGCDRE
jgi:hypothetical protein